jgi:hypothetical protein
MTTQEAYDQMRAWFTRPGAQLARTATITVDGLNVHGCHYRLPAEPQAQKRCAIGCLIPDAIYDPAIEDQSIGTVLMAHRLIDDLLDQVDIHFLEQAQELHDYNGTANVNEFVIGLDNIATRHGLKVAA